jgi:hypothetical protein
VPSILLVFRPVESIIVESIIQQIAANHKVYTSFQHCRTSSQLAVFVSSILAAFVIEITVAAFVNGLWMWTDGFPVPLAILGVI